MRTTLDIDEDVLMAAKELARRQKVSAGQVVSQLLRRTLTGQIAQATASGSGDQGSEPRSVAGFCPFPAGRAVVTNDAVNRLREAEGV
ncbi:MAG: hypothetical protein Q8K18_10015 [Burkholderiales bacterium]|nr:hypothetical protein [Burkholderiales bacterium]